MAPSCKHSRQFHNVYKVGLQKKPPICQFMLVTFQGPWGILFKDNIQFLDNLGWDTHFLN